MKRIFGRKRRDYHLYGAALAFGFTATLVALLISGLTSSEPTAVDAQPVSLQTAVQTETGNTTFAYAASVADKATNIFRPIQSVANAVKPHFLSGANTTRTMSMTEVVEISKGDTLNQIFSTFNIPRKIAIEAVESLKGIFSPRDFRVGQQITLLFRPSGTGDREFRGYRFAADPLREVIVLDTKGTGEFDATVVTKELKTVTLAKQGVITNSLIGAGARAGVPRSVLAEMIRVYSYSIDFQRDIHEGDKFEVMYQAKVDKEGNVYGGGDMLYAKLILNDKEEAVYRFESGGMSDYYKADGSSIRRGLIRTPIDGARMTSGFGFRRHPILGYNKQHKGVDFGARTGTPIFAAGDGVLNKVGWVNGYGNYIKINHNNSLQTAYAHMSRFAKGMRAGVRVKQGQVIGYVGTTGRSTGPHLHYEVLIGGVQVNPIGVKVPTANKLAGGELNKFKAAVGQKNTAFRQALRAARGGTVASR
jgi:murein DD-endopeptidase MepM/ murein hydrolase activator NlpD